MGEDAEMAKLLTEQTTALRSARMEIADLTLALKVLRVTAQQRWKPKYEKMVEQVCLATVDRPIVGFKKAGGEVIPVFKGDT